MIVDFNLINVGIADLQVASGNDILRTILGSCVGICLYDKKAQIGGMSHIMLPSKKARASSDKKYADSAIPLLLKEMEKNGAEQSRITAKIIGGATMFNISENSLMSEIGKNNIAKVKSILKDLKIKIVAEDLGGDYGRTVDFFIHNGEIKIKSLGQDDKVL
jgi:chemotaxis protein CheD